ncbi:MAG: MFS transporter [Deltaproteobacteria bacterium]|nr:MFS transporter [Deltaproteobacteria bacterium]
MSAEKVCPALPLSALEKAKADGGGLPKQTVFLSALVFFSMLSSTLLIPTVRSYMAHLHPGNEGAMHAFMSVNMLGAIIGAPLLCLLADRKGIRQQVILGLALVDGALLFMLSFQMPIWLLLSLRVVQGAANVGGLSLLMGAVSGRGKAIGMAGAALMAAVALGAPIGTALMNFSPLAPLRFGAALSFAIAAAMLVVKLAPVTRAPRIGFIKLLKEAPLLKVPTAFVTIERFAVGCFVVTFSLYGHRALGLGDVEVGRLFSWFLLPFAIATYPFGRIADTVKRSTLVAAGAFTYGVAFLLLGVVPASALPVLLFVTGIASAAIYAPCLCFASTLAKPSMRSTSMSLLNAGGSLGMMIGTATGGILSVVLQKRFAFAPESAYPLIFSVAGVSTLVVLVAFLPALLRADTYEMEATSEKNDVKDLVPA